MASNDAVLGELRAELIKAMSECQSREAALNACTQQCEGLRAEVQVQETTADEYARRNAALAAQLEEVPTERNTSGGGLF